MLKLEALPMEMYGAETIQPNDPRIAVEGYSEEDIAYHLQLLQERGLVEVPDSHHDRYYVYAAVVAGA
ncbi:DUF2513 domain-containing protein [Bradyrhizobium sp. CCGUVB1N3]|uniref:DUF2513 domain-containing protein n=1 Tax=Bradyrhizobium sp. CCGUVB1N3 TaxID=2949629 RepID=UPI0020B3F884|nr:DUF2513 domain-containing protein [Bradyrhizobium sp. CCGUVB1N3]MCP3474624.1 DUF2513 domain-containing protein [Bradyrhizobium sp. CCGUVB1N3]